MKKVIVQIEGMMCGMCEGHICDTIRREFPDAKKVSASKNKSEATFVTDGDISEESLKAVIENTGYHFQSMKVEPYVKKGLFRRG